MSKDILDQAEKHFLKSDKLFEYGRKDIKSIYGLQDSSRTEQDLNHDGRLGVDCSSMVWKALELAGYDVDKEPFSSPLPKAITGDKRNPFATHALFTGKHLTKAATDNFDAISASDARKPNGSLQPGDLLLFQSNEKPDTKHSASQHIAIFKGYDKHGNIMFVGSQNSTGPAQSTITPHGYWDGRHDHIVGALRAKESFRSAEYKQAHQQNVAQSDKVIDKVKEANLPEQAHPIKQSSAQQNNIEFGEQGKSVQQLQANLKALGFQIADDGVFGNKTKQAVIEYQQQNNLTADGIVGAKTSAAIESDLKNQQQANTPETTLSENAKHLTSQTEHLCRKKVGEIGMKCDSRIMCNSASALGYLALSNNFKNVTNLEFSDDFKTIHIGDVSGDIFLNASIGFSVAAQTPKQKSDANAIQFEQAKNQPRQVVAQNQEPTLPQNKNPLVQKV